MFVPYQSALRPHLRRPRLALIAVATTLLLPSLAPAAVLYESGTLGPTGVAYGTTEGTNINPNVYAGVRFELTQPAVTSQVGGHFVAFTGGTFFGALVQLTGPGDFPDSGNLTTPDVLGATMLTFPALSAEVYGNLAMPLSPGWYALVFGSGLFGANGRGGAISNGTDLGAPTYISNQPGATAAWGVMSPTFSDFHFVLAGSVVPEPASDTGAIIIMLLLLCFEHQPLNRRALLPSSR